MKLLRILPLALLMLTLVGCSGKKVSIVLPDNPSARTAYAAGRLQSALEASDDYILTAESDAPGAVNILLIDCSSDEAALPMLALSAEGWAGDSLLQAAEAYVIHRQGDELFVLGSDASGLLYGCLELCERIESGQGLPSGEDVTGHPHMVLRGTCIGLQKPYYLPGRTVYEYPYTEETFPWFYDKEMWIKYLDMLVENRMNCLYLWNGHPFASLVKLPDYPYAVEVSDEQLRQNEELFGFLTEEADKRGIWVIQMFYNIIVSKPFAEHHGIPTQNRKVQITPLLSDYTRKSIAAFIEKYPNVGLLVCLGEAMNTWEDDVEWFTKTIIPGVYDGLTALGKYHPEAPGKDNLPPVVLRAHDTNCEMVMDAALPLYSNLYTMNKYNGESLCTYEPRGPWTATHQALSALGSVHISNVHILANLEPFRYGSPDFIQKSVQAMHNTHGANGLHLYPQASYWDWPYSADRLADGSRLLEMDRDWIWYRAWGRYAWDDTRDRAGETDYWTSVLAGKYGCSRQAAAHILEAYEQSGEISTKLLRKFGITEGNRQTFLLGMFMSQLVNPNRWTVYPDFANSCGPEGEKLEVWAEKEWNGEPHVGETPVTLVAETREHARKAVRAIDAVKGVSLEADEFARLKNDIHCYEAFTAVMTDKIEAAMSVLRYRYSDDIADLEKAETLMKSSLEAYRRLVGLTQEAYLYANSMQTQQRRIPISGAGARNKHWEELLPAFEKELASFSANIEKLKAGQRETVTNEPLKPAQVNMKGSVTGQKDEWVTLEEGAALFYDLPGLVLGCSPELKGLKTLKTNSMIQREHRNTLSFETERPVTLWVGYYAPISPSNRYLNAPKLETDASANDYGQADIKISNALEIDGMPAVNVHSFNFPAGRHRLDLGRGMCLLLGFSEPVNDFRTHDAGLKERSAIDWLFY